MTNGLAQAANPQTPKIPPLITYNIAEGKQTTIAPQQVGLLLGCLCDHADKAINVFRGGCFTSAELR